MPRSFPDKDHRERLLLACFFLGVVGVSPLRHAPEINVQFTRSSVRWVAAIACVLALAGQALSEVETVTTARYDRKLAFKESGTVFALPVKRGAAVKKNDILIQLEDREGESLVALYKLRAQSDVEIQAAAAKHELAQVEEKRIKDMLEKGSATSYEAEKARVSALVAKLEWDLAKQQHEETKLQLEQAEARHERFVMRAPIDGRVETILVAEGEAVEAGKPVLRLVATDPLWIDAPVPIEKTVKMKAGDAAWIQTKLTGKNQYLKGEIIFVSDVAEPASGTRTVQIEVANKQGLPAGEPVVVTFSPPPQPTADGGGGAR